jgi:hypothetical protein
MHRSLLVVAVATMLVGAIVPNAPAQVTAKAIKDSIEGGLRYLKKEQQADGSWAEYTGQPGGLSALCVLAMLNSGVPTEDESIQRALKYLREIRPEKTYATSLQTMVFCRATPKRDMALILRNVRWLEQNQIYSERSKGAWSYPGSSGDNSNSQFAMLALHEAERIGARITPRTWNLARAYWEDCQNPDGSWGYVKGQSGTGSMTCAGITSLIIAADKLQGADAKVDGDRILCCRQQAEPNNRIRMAMKWFGRNFAVTHNPGRDNQFHYYYLYGMERVGRLSANRFLGQHDWYREGAEVLLQKKGGSIVDPWPGQGLEADPKIATSMALLFLAKGRWPVLISKLKHGEEDDWNAHRNDIANLTRHVELQWNRDLVWQVIDADSASVDDLVQSPVLYYCGKNSPLPQDDKSQKELAAKIRDYLDRGGFLIAEGYCGGKGFDQGFRRLMELVFPEPEYALRMLPPEHPIWRTEEVIPPEHIRPMLGIEFGCRTSVVYLPPDHTEAMRPALSCAWELSRPGRDLRYSAAVRGQIDAGLALGINMLAYATNRELRNKEEVFENTAAERVVSDPMRRGKLYIASLKHPGGCAAAPRALTNLLQAAGKELRLRVSVEPRELNIADPSLFDYHMVFMHGRNAFRLTAVERKQLKTFVERGGVVFADSICASKNFSESFHKEMSAIFPETPLTPIPASDPIFSTAFGGFDLSTVSRRDPQGRSGKQPLKSLIRKVPPELDGIKIGTHYGVVFSAYDLSCALEKQDSVECQGYTREDAARIGLNVLLYSLQQ